MLHCIVEAEVVIPISRQSSVLADGAGSRIQHYSIGIPFSTYLDDSKESPGEAAKRKLTPGSYQIRE